MSKAVKQRIRFYSSKDKKFKYKIIETTEIKKLCRQSKPHAVDEAITDLQDWYGLNDVTDERVIEEVEHRVGVWVSNFNELEETRYEVQDKKTGDFREMTEKEMFKEVNQTKAFIKKLRSIL